MEIVKEKFGWKHLLLILTIGYLGFIAIYVVNLPHREAKFNNEKCMYLENGWEYITPSGEVKELSAPLQTEPNVGDELEISYYLPEKMGQTTNTFATWTGMMFLDVYLDSELIYTHENESSFGKVEGSGWLLLRLPNDWEGKKLTLRVASPYPEYLKEFRNFLLGSKASILYEIIHLNWSQFVLSVVLFVMGVLLIFGYLFIRKLLNGERGIAYLGWFQILMGVWMFTECKMTQFIFNNMFVVDTLTYISLLMLPVPLLLYVLENMKSNRKIFLHIMIGLHTITAILNLSFHTFGIKTMYELLPLSHALIAISAIMIVVVTSIETVKYKNKMMRFIGYSVLILTMGGIGELFAFYSGTRMYVGAFMKIGTILCMVLITTVVIKKTLSVVKISSEAVYYEKLALLDFMTQCQNRTAYQKELEKEGKKFSEKEPAAIVLADLNNLKQMNDEIGHHMGDAAIKLCGKLILQVFRDYGNCFRVGGDEFACILTGCSKDTVEKKISEFKMLCEKENNEWEYEFGVAIGYAIYDKKHDRCLEDVIKRADKSMYEDKRKNKVSVERKG